MKNILNTLIEKYKSTLLVFILIFFTGFVSYSNIPKESQPNIEIPYIWVNVYMDGISPEDSEKLIVKPLENEMKKVNNVIYVESEGNEGSAYVFVEFEAGTDTTLAMSNVRDAVNIAKANFPAAAEEPLINEYSSAQNRSALDFMLSGNVSERLLTKIANKLELEIKSIPEVLDVEIAGKRKEMIDVTILPEKMALYNINQGEVFSLFKNNNQIIPAGTMEKNKGSFSFKISGSVDTLEEILHMPVKQTDNVTLTFQDIAEIKRIFKAPTSFARINNKKTIAFSVKKREGQNILNTVEEVKLVISDFQSNLPDSIDIKYTFDGSEDVNELITDLENNILSSVILVALVILGALGFRTSVLVGLAIPGAFLMGIICLYFMGISLNMVVLFSLIMSIGMLVDGAIVVSEYADKKMQEGYDKKEAFKEASSRMSMPIISSTATTLAAFFPLLYWTGTTGQFMKYLPITLIVTLTSSIFMALVFIPTLGSKFGKKYKNTEEANNIKQLKLKNYDKIKGMEGIYFPFLNYSVKHPITVLACVILFSITIATTYLNSNKGTIFFPEGNSDAMSLIIKADGDYSIYEKNEMVKEIEEIVIKKYSKYVDFFYTSISHGENIGKIKLTFKDWKERPKSADIADILRKEFKDYSGVKVEMSEQKEGPTSGKDLQLSIGSNSSDKLYNIVKELNSQFKSLNYLIEVTDDYPQNGIQWDFNVDREKATRFGTSLSEIGASIQMITNGVKISEYRPEDIEDELDIRVRYPEKDRNIQTLQTLTINTKFGQVPLSTFVTQTFSPKISSIFRLNGMKDVLIMANMKEGEQLSNHIDELKKIIKDVVQDDPDIRVDFQGDQEESDETMNFLIKAFGISIFIMFMILVAQFNSYYQTFIVLSAIIFSTMGVLGLLYFIEQPFGIVMGGIGLISLSGIVINNNIVLIDTFNEKLKFFKGDYYTAIIETGVERLRPVFLTTITTILGLIPMALKLNIDVMKGTVLYDSPSSQFWYQLAYTLIGGMSFAFFITLLVTPALLVLFKKYNILTYIKRKQANAQH
jgi:multidrug efflux pump